MSVWVGKSVGLVLVHVLRNYHDKYLFELRIAYHVAGIQEETELRVKSSERSKQ